MKLREIRIRSFEALEKLVRDLVSILGADSAGIRWNDNIAPLVTYDHEVFYEPVTVRTQETEEPLAVLVLDVITKGNDEALRLSLPALQWRWDSGSIIISDIDGVTSTTVVYAVTLGILRG